MNDLTIQPDKSESIDIPNIDIQTIAKTRLFGYVVKTIKDGPLNIFKTIVYPKNMVDVLDLSKFEIEAYSEDSAMNTHVEAMRYICKCLGDIEVKAYGKK